LLGAIKTKNNLHPVGGHFYKMAAKSEQDILIGPRGLNIFALVYVSTYYVPSVMFVSSSAWFFTYPPCTTGLFNSRKHFRWVC